MSMTGFSRGYDLRAAGTARAALLALGVRCAYGPCAWPLTEGCYLLLRWDGERRPYPTLDGSNGRPALIVGFALAGATSIKEFADVTHAAGTTYHYAVVAVGPGGVAEEIAPERIVTRVFDGGGALLGLMPNAPAAIAADVVTGNKPLIRWAYSRWYEQVTPVRFEVYASSGAAFNFATPAGTVSWQSGVTGYEWTGAALTAGDARWYTVRAVSAAGVKSLIPRTGLTPSPDYAAVELARCPKVIVPAAPSAGLSLYLEAMA